MILLFLTAGTADLRAQVNLPEASTRSGRPHPKDDLPEKMKENLYKKKLEQEKKEFEEMIRRGEEAAKLSEEITLSFEKQNNLSAEDRKKLERLEKLVKKIRDDLGGKDDDEMGKERPADLINALKAVRENAENLLSALKKTTRLSISAVAIESSNTVLKLIKFIRFSQN